MNDRLLKLLDERSITIQEYNLLEQVGHSYWHSNILRNGEPVAGGFGPTKNESRKIAYAEYLERTSFLKIKNSAVEVRKSWGMDLISTGCGFAAGFDLRNTILRSIGEALERWTLSKWIDEDYKLNQLTKIETMPNLDPVSKWFVEQFEDVIFFEKSLAIGYGNQFYRYQIGVSVAVCKTGVFIGSSSQVNDGSVWQHALLESYRHFLMNKNSKPTNLFPDNKVRFFATNKDVAFSQIFKEKIHKWQDPQISFHRNEHFKDQDFFLSRTIINGWRPWNLGPIERFLY